MPVISTLNVVAQISRFLKRETTSQDKIDLRGDLAAAPLASPVFTGIPAAPTATAGTNTTQLATTAFVKTLGDTKQPQNSNLTAYAADPTAAILANMPDALSGTGLPGEGTVYASASLNPDGDNNTVLYTAKSPAGNDISIEYTLSASSLATSITVTGRAIRVGLGGKARQSFVAPGAAAASGTLIRTVRSVPNFTTSGLDEVPLTGTFWSIAFEGSYWVATRYVDGTALNTWVSSGATVSPDVATWGTDITVTPAVSSAAQVISAVNNTLVSSQGAASAALVTASAVGDVSGAAAAIGATFLAGGVTEGVPSFHGQLYRDTSTTPDTWYRWNGTEWQEDAGASTTASIVTLLGLPTFATLAAANASGDIEIGSLFYNTALSKLDITTA